MKFVANPFDQLFIEFFENFGASRFVRLDNGNMLETTIKKSKNFCAMPKGILISIIEAMGSKTFRLCCREYKSKTLYVAY